MPQPQPEPPERTFADLDREHPSWQAVADEHRTWADLTKPDEQEKDG